MTAQGDENDGRKASGGPLHGISGPGPRRFNKAGGVESYQGTVYGALDLGTNNCRLLIAHPTRRGFRVIDAFSRIIRLGEGLSTTGRLSEPAMERTIEALRVCASKLNRAGRCRSRLVATEACRVAENGREFLDRVGRDLGLNFEILSPEQEARLAVSGCASLIDESADYVLVFDIGGGSSEIIWLDVANGRGRSAQRHGGAVDLEGSLVAWTSLPVGVVTLAERYGGKHVTFDAFEAMVAHVTGMIGDFESRHSVRSRIADGSVHMLGTSGTVTTVAGIKLGLPRYERSRVDGYWLATQDVRDVTSTLLRQSYEERVAQPCIGRDRADLVLAGCAILEGFLRMWPCDRLRVADRGLREGILSTLMKEDGSYRAGRGPHFGAGRQSSQP